jgi:hypothetical protein
LNQLKRLANFIKKRPSEPRKEEVLNIVETIVDLKEEKGASLRRQQR